MSDEPFSSGEQPVDQPPGPPPAQRDWRAERDARRAERRAWREQRRAGRWSRGYGGWIGGALLILLGVIFLLQNFGLTYPVNWWALFILIPALGAFGAAWNLYQQTGQLGAPARGALIGGALLTLVAAVFLFNLNWGLVIPVLLILAGIAMLVNLVLPG
jgi:hypothetical protein